MSTWQEVGDGCFRRRYRAFDLNIGVVRGSDSLLVLDTRADLRQADELLDDLTVFGPPVRWVVNSHWHFDHTFGNQRFVEAAAGDGDPAPWRSPATSSCGATSTSPRRCSPTRPSCGPRSAPCYGDEAGDEYDRVVLTPPDHLVVEPSRWTSATAPSSSSTSVAGTPATTSWWSCPTAEVVFAGDLLEESAPPAYGDDCFPLEWPATAGAVVGRRQEPSTSPATAT